MEKHSALRGGATLMLLAALAFIVYGVIFFFRSFTGSGFEIGVQTLGGMTKSELAAAYPAIAYYITHLHVATAAFIIATGVAVAALAWWGVRAGAWWAWWAAVIAPVVGLALALPMHWTADAFAHDWATHLGPIYLATLVYVAGALWALGGLLGGRRPITGWASSA